MTTTFELPETWHEGLKDSDGNAISKRCAKQSQPARRFRNALVAPVAGTQALGGCAASSRASRSRSRMPRRKRRRRCALLHLLHVSARSSILHDTLQSTRSPRVDTQPAPHAQQCSGHMYLLRVIKSAHSAKQYATMSHVVVRACMHTQCACKHTLCAARPVAFQCRQPSPLQKQINPRRRSQGRLQWKMTMI